MTAVGSSQMRGALQRAFGPLALARELDPGKYAAKLVTLRLDAALFSQVSGRDGAKLLTGLIIR